LASGCPRRSAEHQNPKAEQTKAILKLAAPIGWRSHWTCRKSTLDLWSNFQPGYLGKEAQFRKNFEVPIQKNNDLVRSAPQKLVEPWATDQSIIKDLPDKVEQSSIAT